MDLDQLENDKQNKERLAGGNSELKKYHSETKVKYDNLSENFKSLELRLKGNKEVKESYFPCKNCENIFTTLTELKKHQECHK